MTEETQTPKTDDVWIPNPARPPSTAPYYKFAAEKWDHDRARNALLWFVHSRGLDAECLEWLDGRYPDED